jgi:hypothetical protein
MRTIVKIEFYDKELYSNFLTDSLEYKWFHINICETSDETLTREILEEEKETLSVVFKKRSYWDDPSLTGVKKAASEHMKIVFMDTLIIDAPLFVGTKFNIGRGPKLFGVGEVILLDLTS